MQGVASKLGGGARSGGPAGRAAAGLSRRGRPEGARCAACVFHRPAPPPAGPRGPAFPVLSPAPDARPAPLGPRGGRPQEGLEFLPGGPLLPSLLGARFLPLPARPPPGRQPTACPRGRQEATCPRKECRACRAGGGRWAGPGRAGPGRERPAGKVGERERASPRPPRPPAPPLSRPLRRPGLITASHTFPA